MMETTLKKVGGKKLRKVKSKRLIVERKKKNGGSNLHESDRIQMVWNMIEKDTKVCEF